MRSIASCIPLLLTGTILIVGMILLASGRLEYCGQPESLRPRTDACAAAEVGRPTLAPPQKVVFLRVETDKPDIEVNWAEN